MSDATEHGVGDLRDEEEAAVTGTNAARAARVTPAEIESMFADTRWHGRVATAGDVALWVFRSRSGTADPTRPDRGHDAGIAAVSTANARRTLDELVERGTVEVRTGWRAADEIGERPMSGNAPPHARYYAWAAQAREHARRVATRREREDMLANMAGNAALLLGGRVAGVRRDGDEVVVRCSLGQICELVRELTGVDMRSAAMKAAPV